MNLLSQVNFRFAGNTGFPQSRIISKAADNICWPSYKVKVNIKVVEHILHWITIQENIISMFKISDYNILRR